MEALRQRRRAGGADRPDRSAQDEVSPRRGGRPGARRHREGGPRAPRHPGALETGRRSAARPGAGLVASLSPGRRSDPGQGARVLRHPIRGAQGQPRSQAGADRACRGVGRIDRLDQDGGGAEDAPAGMAADRRGAAHRHPRHLEALPRSVRQVLHPPQRRSRGAQGNLVGQPCQEGGAVRPRRGAVDVARLGSRRRRDPPPPGRVEDHRTGAPEQVGGDLAALPGRRGYVLRSLQASRRDRPRGQAGRSRGAHHRARTARRTGGRRRAGNVPRRSARTRPLAAQRAGTRRHRSCGTAPIRSASASSPRSSA